LSSAFGFFLVLVVLVVIFPLVFIAMIEEIRRCREWPPPGIRNVAELEVCLVNNSRPGFDVNPLRW
jgi:hypothetical protein